jgi:hypothetical protein
LNVLYIAGPLSPRDWLPKALSDGAAGAIDVTVTPSLLVGLEHLREQAFDVVVVDRDASDRSAADLMLAIHASTHEHQSVLVLSDHHDRTEAADYLLAGAAGYLLLHLTTIQELIWQLHSAAQLARLQVENQRLRSWQERYREHEQTEVLGLLDEQSQLFAIAAGLREHSASSGPLDAKTESIRLQQAFRELLQAYVVMGRGQLTGEVQDVVNRLHAESHSLAATLHAFTKALRSLVQDRGARTSRHVLNRGNLLLLDLLLKWADRQPRREANEHFRRHSHL